MNLLTTCTNEEDILSIMINGTLHTLIPDKEVYAAINSCHSDWELLQFSSHCLALSSIALELRLKAGTDTFGGLIETLTTDEAMHAEIFKCLEIMLERRGERCSFDV